MRHTASIAVMSLSVLGMTASNGSGGPPYGACYTLVWVPPGTSGSCPGCTYIPPFDYVCPAASVENVTSGYWRCARAGPGAAGSTRCTTSRIQVGNAASCAMFPNTKVIVECEFLANVCVEVCEACLVPGVGWGACIPCAGCLALADIKCVGCEIRVCTTDPATARPLYRYTGTLSGDACTG